jgi:hypothetical protein
MESPLRLTARSDAAQKRHRKDEPG